MAPDQPPLPKPMNLPFQPSAGIHTSTLISESEVGRMVAASRQKAGSSRNAACRAGLRLGSVKAPADTASALVMVVAGKESVDRLSQPAPRAVGTASSARIKELDKGPPLDSVLRAALRACR